MDLSRKDFIGGALSGAVVLAAPRALAKAKGEKMALTGLTPVASETVKPPTFKEANLVLECRTLYRQPMTESSFIDRSPFERWYSSADDLHIMYIAEVLAVRQAK